MEDIQVQFDISFEWGGILPVIVSKNVRFKNIKGNVKIINPHMGGIRLGFHEADICDRSYQRLIWDCTGMVILEGDASIGIGSVISVSGFLYIGNGTSINSRSTIKCAKEIRLGRNIMISYDCLIMDTDMHRILDKMGRQINSDKAVRIGDHVWIGTRCVILKGSCIPENNIIAAGSMIHKIFDCKYSVIANHQIVEQNVYWRI